MTMSTTDIHTWWRAWWNHLRRGIVTWFPTRTHRASRAEGKEPTSGLGEDHGLVVSVLVEDNGYHHYIL